MKFVVDELPYYEEFCPFGKICDDNASDDKCPQHWSKYKICSDDNPHECCLLIEACLMTFAKPEQKNNPSDAPFCSNCKHFENTDILKSPCPTCIGFSNWEARKELMNFASC